VKKLILSFMTILALSGCSNDTDKWISLEFKEQLFNAEIAFADINIPAIRTIGKAKFIKSGSAFKLGYLVNVEFDPLDITKIPKKYLQEKKITVDGVTLTQLPTEAVSIEAKMIFYLKDKDGFSVYSLTSAPFSILSGSNSQIKRQVAQDTLEGFIDVETVKRTDKIEVIFSLLRCNTCSK
jgi:hypothetical protein